LTGGIVDDYEWQNYWRGLTVFPEFFYNMPKGPTGKCFLGMLTQELLGIIDCKWNSLREIDRILNCYFAEDTIGRPSLRHQEAHEMEN
jgi:hypothetical protein